MYAIPAMDEARSVGESVAAESIQRVRSRVQHQVRRSLGIRGEARRPCDDPAEAYFEPGCITRQIHSDLPAMLIGGVAALLFQMLHPLAMAGVAEFSNYRRDPLGRLERTASFLGTTTFCSGREAEAAIARVRTVHASVVGTAPDGRPFSASDPALITWVHAAEVQSFLNATVAYGPHPLTLGEQDRYVDEMARVALALGADVVPRTTAELDAYFDAVRPELQLTRQARVARNFVLRGVGRWPHEITTYGLLVAAAQGVLPPWARRQLHLAQVPAGDRLAVRPTARALATALRWVAAPPTPTRTEANPVTDAPQAVVSEAVVR
jgi:uncharacterized protein (DUF2236 family)